MHRLFSYNFFDTREQHFGSIYHVRTLILRTNYYTIDALTPLCLSGPFLPTNMLSSKHPKDHISTPVVYSTSYGPDITKCIDTYIKQILHYMLFMHLWELII